jgi:hypothetical protein
MNKSKIRSVALGVLALLGGVGSLHAAIIQAGDYTIVLKNFDSGTVGYGNSVGVKCATVSECDTAGTLPSLGSIGSVNTSADTMGIFLVQSITKGGQLLPYWSPSANSYLTGVFGNLMDHSVTVNNNLVGTCSTLAPGSCTSTSRSVGGLFSIWETATPLVVENGPAVIAGVKDLNALLYPSISDSGSLYLSGNFGAGVILDDLVSTFQATFNNGTISGGSSGYLDFTGGSALDMLNTNNQTDPNGGKHDAFADFTFSATDPGAESAAYLAGWNVSSAAKVLGQAIPEPDSLALFAVALLGLATVARRKGQASKG